MGFQFIFIIIPIFLRIELRLASLERPRCTEVRHYLASIRLFFDCCLRMNKSVDRAFLFNLLGNRFSIESQLVNIPGLAPHFIYFNGQLSPRVLIVCQSAEWLVLLSFGYTRTF